MAVCLEKEALALHDEAWAETDSRTGRANRTEWVVVKVERPKNNNKPITSRAGLAWRWLDRTITTMLALKGWKCRRPPPEEREMAPARQKEWTYMKQALERGVPRLAALPADIAEEWRGFIPQVVAEAVSDERVGMWGEWARREADKLDKEVRKQRKEEWTNFLEEAAAGGAGMLHRLSKPAQVWQPRASAGESAKQACPLAAAAAARATWADEWRVQVDDLQTGPQPWLTYKVDLPALEAGSLIAVGSRFKKHTGVGADRVHPRIASLLSWTGEQAMLDYIQLVERSR